MTDSFSKLIIYLYLNHFLWQENTYCIMSDATVIQFKWGPGHQASPSRCDLLFSKTHSMCISLCICSTFCLPQLSCLCQSCRGDVTLRKHNKLRRQEQVIERKAEHSSSLICSVSIHTSRRHSNCCQQVTHSIKHPILGYKAKHILFLDSADRIWCIWMFWKATRFFFFQTGERAFKQHSIQGFFFASPPTDALHCFNSQEKQLKAGTRLTYTQRSKIDQWHPAWTNHSTEVEAGKQT